MPDDLDWIPFFEAPSARRERPSNGTVVRWEFRSATRQFVVLVGQSRTYLELDHQSGLEFGYQSKSALLTATAGVPGVIHRRDVLMSQAKGLGITRRNSRVILRSADSQWFWQKQGVVARFGSAHACFRSDGTAIARTRGFRWLELSAQASPFEADLVALSFASSATELCAKAGLSSLFWF